jgi:ligand-binding sensor domain-containing protein
MITYMHIYLLLLMFAFCTSCQGQNKTEPQKENIKRETKSSIAATVPNSITRNIIQDRNGNIWIAAFDGIFRYDGKVFANMTSKVSSAHFFSVLEDRKGNFWFGSIGSGVYYYDGKSFKNFTIREGLLNNEVTSIYEDKKGNTWFGVSGGASCYDGKSFRNYIIDGNIMNEDRMGKTFPNRRPYEVTSIIESKAGQFRFATRGNTFVYDGEIFNTISHNGKPFKNVRSIIEDKKGNIWLGGADGLWRYDGRAFTNITPNFVGYIYEDKKGNIWTSSVSAYNKTWALARYDEHSLSNKKPTASEIKSGETMLFGILEANDGSIWVGGWTGVYRYNGKAFESFKGNEVRITGISQ